MLRTHRSIGLFLAVATLFTICVPAWAYIDAGSGSYLLQILFAMLFGAAYTVKATWHNLKTVLFRRNQPAPAASGADPAESQRA
jgi:hypothetical protein